MANSSSTKKRPLRVKRPAAGAANPAKQSAQAATCPLCGGEGAETEIGVGPIYTKVCGGCSNLAFHAMGLFDWIKSKTKAS